MPVSRLLTSKRQVLGVRYRIMEPEQHDVHLCEEMPFMFGRREPKRYVRALTAISTTVASLPTRIMDDFPLLAEHISALDPHKQRVILGAEISSDTNFGMPRSSVEDIAAFGVIART